MITLTWLSCFVHIRFVFRTNPSNTDGASYTTWCEICDSLLLWFRDCFSAHQILFINLHLYVLTRPPQMGPPEPLDVRYLGRQDLNGGAWILAWPWPQIQQFDQGRLSKNATSAWGHMTLTFDLEQFNLA